MSCCFWFFFFKQKTAYEMRISDWSSDVCSSDLAQPDHGGKRCGDIAELVGAQREDRGNRLVEQAAGGGANLCGLSEQSRRGVSRSGRDGAIAVRGRQPFDFALFGDIDEEPALGRMLGRPDAEPMPACRQVGGRGPNINDK